MDKENDLSKLNKKELIEIINSYKEKLASIEEHVRVMKPDYMVSF